MICNICQVEQEQIEVIAPPVNSKLLSKEILKFNGFRIVFAGKLPKPKNTCNENAKKPIISSDDYERYGEIKFYKYWNLCADCRRDIINKYRTLSLPFELAAEEKEALIKTILTEGIDSITINKKEIEHQEELKTWRNRKKYRN